MRIHAPAPLVLLLGLAILGTPGPAARAQVGGPAAGQGADAVPEPVARDLQRLHASNRSQVALGRIAITDARDERVRELAGRVVDAHRRSDRRLDELAVARAVDLTGAAFGPRYDEGLAATLRLDESGAAAKDRVYLDQLLLDLRRSAREVRQAASTARREGQPEIAAFLDETVLAVDHQLEQVAALRAEVGPDRAAARRGGAGTPGRQGAAPAGGGARGAPAGGGAAGQTPPPRAPAGGG